MIRLVISSLFLYPVLGNPIVGEHICDIEVHPWLASIQTGGYHNCVGSIISESVILTAAHCLVGPAESYIVRVGSSRTDSGGSWHQVVAKKYHEKYGIKLNRTVNDVALLKVSPSFTFGRAVSKIQLNKAGSKVEPNLPVMIAGWGSDSYGGSVSLMLKSNNLLTVDSQVCSKAYGDNSGTIISSNSQICAAMNGSDACDGDNGAPLIAINIQIGIASLSVGCANPNYPRVYTDVAHYREWIDINARILELQEYKKVTPVTGPTNPVIWGSQKVTST